MPRSWSHRYRTVIHGDRLTIRRHDGKSIRCGWDTLQKIKNEILGEETTAIEIFPSKNNVVNETNSRHFWIVHNTENIPSFQNRSK